MHWQFLRKHPLALLKVSHLLTGGIWGVMVALTVNIVPIPKATAQIPLLSPWGATNSVNDEANSKIIKGWIYLDGRPLFQIAAPKTSFSERLQNIQVNLQEISDNYFHSSITQLKVDSRKINGLPVIFINDRYLMTVTSQDAEQQYPWTLANQITTSLQTNLAKGKHERQTHFLIQQSGIAGISFLAMMMMSWGIYRWQNRIKHNLAASVPLTSLDDQPITSQLNEQHYHHLQEVRKRLFQLAQTGLWGSATFVILGLFPYTRAFQLGIVTVVQIPLRLGMVILGTYVAIRFIYALIERSTSTIVSSSALLTPETSERLQLRVSTFSGVTKSIATILCIGVGILLGLVALGIDVIPLLAGASLIGVAVSLASQNLIKDAINGFLIILEDQYALGDVINVSGVSGLVENLNLRMTQIRDSEGRLITIPNSEIKIVANLSSRWSRADLTIPVSYQADINEAIKLIENVALQMNDDAQWQHQIIETPKVLGIDNFGDRGLMIRVWIKTQPLKQWDVAREYRRRLKVTLDEAGIFIPSSQQEVWINHHPSLSVQQGDN